MQFEKWIKPFLTLCVIALLQACGGGSGGESSDDSLIDTAALGENISQLDFSPCIESVNNTCNDDGAGGGGTDGGADGGTDSVTEPTGTVVVPTDTVVDPESGASSIEQILNPDNCTESQLGALSELGLSSSTNIATRPVRGAVTYKRPTQLNDGRLDFGSILTEFAYGSSINAIACDGRVIDASFIYGDGAYLLKVPFNIEVTLKIVAAGGKIRGDDFRTSSWDVVVMNNIDQETYTYDVPNPSAPSSGQVDGATILPGSIALNDINVDIPLGSNGVTSAPFAIANSVFSMLGALLGDAGDRTFGLGRRGEGFDLGQLLVGWSQDNVPAFGQIDQGQIGFSGYNKPNKAIFLLGAQNVNTDEFDQDVIRAKTVEFVIDKLARQDRELPFLDGERNFSEVFNAKLDPRVAFADGFSIGLANGVFDQQFYKDSRGSNFSTSQAFDLESGAISVPGWFSIGSIGQMVYDLVDTGSDEQLNILSFELIDALREASSSVSFVTAFSFLSALKRTEFDDIDGKEDDDGNLDVSPLSPVQKLLIDQLAAANNIASLNEIDDVIIDEIDDADLEGEKFEKATGLTEYNAVTWGGAPGFATSPNVGFTNTITKTLTVVDSSIFPTTTTIAVEYGGTVTISNVGATFTIAAPTNETETITDSDDYLFNTMVTVLANGEQCSAQVDNAGNWSCDVYVTNTLVLQANQSGPSEIQSTFDYIATFAVDFGSNAKYLSDVFAPSQESIYPMVASQLGATNAETLQLYYHFGLFGASANEVSANDVCSSSEFGVGSYLGNRRFIAFTIFDKDEFEASQSISDTKPDVEISITKTSGPADAKLFTRLYKAGGPLEEISFGDAVLDESASQVVSLEPGGYLLEFGSAANITNAATGAPGEVCYNVSVKDSSPDDIN